jgi:hypothetical protein
MMKQISLLCTLFLLLVTSSSAYAGVTDGDVTAYRLAGNTKYVVFTDDPLDDPDSVIAPLGTAYMSVTSCTASVGTASITGLVCSGTSGEPVANYSCTTGNSILNASNTTWCLFSENPRTGDKAWAVKYTGGFIPTNDGDSIVRCKGADKFDSENGCTAGPSEIGIKGGYINLETTDGSAPPDSDCSLDAHNGRMIVDDVNNLLYICTDSGWISK